eukprot:scaffold34915_cov58-Phaeocystis_antarctica.AAC.1
MAEMVPPEAAARTAPTARTVGRAICRRHRRPRPRPRRPTLSLGRPPPSLAAAPKAPSTALAPAPNSFTQVVSLSPRTATSRLSPCVPGLAPPTTPHPAIACQPHAFPL